MRISSGVAQVNNIFIYPKYPKQPVSPAKKVDHNNYSSIQGLGTFNVMKIMQSRGYKSNNVVLTVPDGSVLIGYLIDFHG